MSTPTVSASKQLTPCTPLDWKCSIQSLQQRLVQLEQILQFNTTLEQPLQAFTLAPLQSQQQQHQQQQRANDLISSVSNTQIATAAPLQQQQLSVIEKFKELSSAFQSTQFAESLHQLLQRSTQLEHVLHWQIPPPHNSTDNSQQQSGIDETQHKRQQLQLQMQQAELLSRFESLHQTDKQLQSVQQLSHIVLDSDASKSSTSSKSSVMQAALPDVQRRLDAAEQRQKQLLHHVAQLHVSVDRFSILYGNICDALSLKFLQLHAQLLRLEKIKDKSKAQS